MIFSDSFSESFILIARLIWFCTISFTLFTIGSKFYIVDKLSVKIKLILIVGVIVFSGYTSKLIASVLHVF